MRWRKAVSPWTFCLSCWRRKRVRMRGQNQTGDLDFHGQNFKASLPLVELTPVTKPFGIHLVRAAEATTLHGTGLEIGNKVWSHLPCGDNVWVKFSSNFAAVLVTSATVVLAASCPVVPLNLRSRLLLGVVLSPSNLLQFQLYRPLLSIPVFAFPVVALPPWYAWHLTFVCWGFAKKFSTKETWRAWTRCWVGPHAHTHRPAIPTEVLPALRRML